MFWGDSIIDSFLSEYKDEVGKRKFVLRDEKTLSGRPHVGSLRSFVMHATLSDILTDRGINHEYWYEINDTDAFDSVPAYVPPKWKEHLGKRLLDVPSPSGDASNFARFFAKEYLDVLKSAKYQFVHYFNSEKYFDGSSDRYMRLALDHKDEIRSIYKEVSGSVKPESWYPCQVVCDSCGKIATTRIVAWDGNEVKYICDHDAGYVKGCGHHGQKSPFGGSATLPWKVEWAAKFCVMSVDLEGAGKDHYAAGGSRHVANKICEKIFGHKHPFDVRHEFILISGAKMSSSAGVGATAAEVYDLLPRHIFRFMMIQKDIMKTINFSPEGNTVPILFDLYDEISNIFFASKRKSDMDTLTSDKCRIFSLTHFHEKDVSALPQFLPRFSHVVFYVQLPHVNVKKKFEEIKGAPLTDAEEKELNTRIEYAHKWLDSYSPEEFVFKIQETMPPQVSHLTTVQKELLATLADFLQNHPDASGEQIQTFLYDVKNERELDPITVFQAIYIALLGRDSGPKAGWLLEALEKDFLVKRFSEVKR